MKAWKRFRRNKMAFWSLVFLAFVGFMAVFAPLVTTVSFEVQDMQNVLATPNHSNWFGTDSLGRDLYSRVVYGARVSLAVGVVSSLISLLLGTIYGLIAGFWGGWIDRVLMRFLDVLQSIPALVLLILVSAFVNATSLFENEALRSMFGILLALGVIGWSSMARLVRGQVLQAREMLYVDAARAMGAGTMRIMLRHILPNIAGPMVVMLSLQVPSHILFESFLSFIGLGLQPPYSSWGVLANEGWRSLRAYPHLILFPGLVLFLTMMAFNLLGDGLRDAIDRKMSPT